MINKIQNFISKNNLFSKDDCLLLAISGGADSVFLFFVLKELGYNIQLAHCNFNLRGEESNQDEYFVKKLAAKHDVYCHIKSFETQKYAKKNKLSIQMAARELRYTWFNELLDDKNLDFILVAQHKDDNVETFLINLIRGSGIYGLCGIKAVNHKIVRPLIQITREEIENYLINNGIDYCNDSSNKDLKYLRNKVRYQLIPLLKEMNPSIKQTISDEMSYLGGVNKFFEQQINVLKTKLLIENDGVYKISISQLLNLDHLEIILFEILKPFGFSQIVKIKKAIKSSSGKRFFSSKYQLIIDREVIIISLLHPPDKDIEIFDSEFEIKSPLSLRFYVSTDCSIDKNLNLAKLDFDKIFFPLLLRKWRRGDRFKPLGMNNFKKLSDFFIDQKYSMLEKESQWILCSGDNIVWIVGKRIDDRFKIDSKTKKVYIAELLKKD